MTTETIKSVSEDTFVSDVIEKSKVFECTDDLLSGIESIEPLTWSRVLIESAIGIQKVDGSDPIFVTLPNFVVIRVVCWGDFYAP